MSSHCPCCRHWSGKLFLSVSNISKCFWIYSWCKERLYTIFCRSRFIVEDMCMNIQTDTVHVLHIYMGTSQACPNKKVVVWGVGCEYPCCQWGWAIYCISWYKEPTIIISWWVYNYRHVVITLLMVPPFFCIGYKISPDLISSSTRVKSWK